jgi:hypothetical protein
VKELKREQEHGQNSRGAGGDGESAKWSKAHVRNGLGSKRNLGFLTFHSFLRPPFPLPFRSVPTSVVALADGPRRFGRRRKVKSRRAAATVDSPRAIREGSRCSAAIRSAFRPSENGALTLRPRVDFVEGTVDAVAIGTKFFTHCRKRKR